jgi:hypothetical protein
MLALSTLSLSIYCLLFLNEQQKHGRWEMGEKLKKPFSARQPPEAVDPTITPSPQEIIIAYPCVHILSQPLSQ